MSTSDAEVELQKNILTALDQVSAATRALREFQLEEARDEGFEAGVIAAENGFGRV